MHPLTTVRGAIISAFVLAIILSVILTTVIVGADGLGLHHARIDRWLHIVSGVMWIGLLYYFNVVQVPSLADATADKGGPGGAGITKYVAPRALLWFRWSAVVTWLTGVWYLARAGALGAFALGMSGPEFNLYQFVIGVGAWLGTIMLFNVWFFIWPNQQKILGIKPATDEQKAAARKTALYASRTNYIHPIPIPLCMAGATHGLPF